MCKSSFPYPIGWELMVIKLIEKVIETRHQCIVISSNRTTNSEVKNQITKNGGSERWGEGGLRGVQVGGGELGIEGGGGGRKGRGRTRIRKE